MYLYILNIDKHNCIDNSVRKAISFYRFSLFYRFTEFEDLEYGQGYTH